MKVFEVFEARLLSIVTTLCESDELLRAPIMQQHLQKQSPQAWADEISDMTLLQAIPMLGAERPVTATELARRLPRIRGIRDPGGYIDCVLPVDHSANREARLYVGSATGIGGGLTDRTDRHLNRKYRKQRPSEHYRAIDDTKTKRLPNLRLLYRDEFTSLRKEDIDHVVARDLLAETVYMCWLGAFSKGARSMMIQRPYSQLCPWRIEDLDYGGTNFNVPLHDGFTPQSTDALTIGPEELQRRAASAHQDRRRSMSEAQMTHDREKRRDLKKRMEVLTRFAKIEPRLIKTLTIVWRAINKQRSRANMPKRVNGKFYTYDNDEPRKTAYKANIKARKYGPVWQAAAAARAPQPSV